MSITSLWPEDIKATVESPLDILKGQEAGLEQLTQGKLKAVVSSIESDHLVQHQLDLIAPKLNFYRERLLSLTHARDKMYPVIVRSEAFKVDSWRVAKSGGLLHLPSVDPTTPFSQSLTERKGTTDVELQDLIKVVLGSSFVRSLIASLIAQIDGLPNGQTTATP
jgi:hypothetical protein